MGFCIAAKIKNRTQEKKRYSICSHRCLGSVWAPAQSYQPSLRHHCIAKDLNFLHADIEDG